MTNNEREGGWMCFAFLAVSTLLAMSHQNEKIGAFVGICLLITLVGALAWSKGQIGEAISTSGCLTMLIVVAAFILCLIFGW